MDLLKNLLFACKHARILMIIEERLLIFEFLLCLVVFWCSFMGIDYVGSTTIFRDWSFWDVCVSPGWIQISSTHQLSWWIVRILIICFYGIFRTCIWDLCCCYRFAVMACCWLAIPEERPTFVQLLAFLQDFYTALGRYI